MDRAEFSRYRIVSRLGQGGMGEVFLAEDVTLVRKVALKFLQAAGDDEAASRRLLNEARAAAHLDHPFICKVYEVDDHDGRSFLAMEYVDGITLGQRLARGRVPIAEIRRIAKEIADALHFAHTRGVIHRDLKPANVMLGADDHVKVMDFGIAKRRATSLGADAATASLETGSAHVSGTFAYMSPEQLRGEAVDERSDIFAFGVLLYELLAGRNPFARTSMLESASAILSEPVPPVETERPDTPPLVARVVARCLEKDRTRRYQSLADVRLELEAPETSSAFAVRPPPPKRRKWLAGAAIAAIIALGALAQRTFPLPFLAPGPALAFEERDWILVADFNNLTGDPVFDRSLRLALEVAIAQSQYVNVFPQNRVTATFQRMQREAADRVDEALAAEVAVREGVRAVLACDIAQLGNVYSLTARLVDPKTRAPVLTDSIEANGKDRVLSALGELAARVRSNLGESLKSISEQGRALPQVTTSSLDALKLYADALKYREGNDAQSNEMLLQALAIDADFALAHAELGRRFYLASARASRELGEQHLLRALALTARLTPRERLWIQAITEDSRGNRERAVAAYKAYLAQYPDDTRALFRVSWTQMAGLGQSAEAADGFRRLLEIDPHDSAAQVNLATALSGMADFNAAIAAYQRAFEIEPRLALAVYVNHEYGFTLAQVGRFDEAARGFERMKQEGEAVNQSKGFRSAALLEMLRGRYGNAIRELRRAISLDQTYHEMLSEFRDRLYLITAFEATARERDARNEWADVERLIAKLSLSPGWLWRAARMKARSGRLDDAQRYVRNMQQWVGKATADSGVSRNLAEDDFYVAASEAELALAEGRLARALERIEPAHLYLKSPETLATLAAVDAAAGRAAEAIARYEELVSKPAMGYEAQQTWLAAHVALGKLYEEQRRPADATKIYLALAERWKEGDPDLVLLQTARERLQALQRQ